MIAPAARSLNCRGRLLLLDRPKVMGILNVTPDSFYDGGRHDKPDAALRKAEQMLAEGADILDIGGYSSRPGADDVPAEEETRRLAVVVEAIRREFPEAMVSIDTFRASVAREMLDRGAHILNDITAGEGDPEMFAVAAQSRAPLMLMHMQGNPRTMQQNPQYSEVVGEVYDYLCERVALAREAGVRDLVVDPGFGFGKSLAHNYSLFGNLRKFKALGLPLLVGISRKSMVYKPFGLESKDALELSTALHLEALQTGADLLRVHDVAPAVRVIRLYEMLNGAF